ncbi:MAG: rod shape-determining protein MreD [Candidatus Omnitrophica bacterium]|nr:rod shape-determining protein MreD [Candidatus Omnitrophota bacterium]
MPRIFSFKILIYLLFWLVFDFSIRPSLGVGYLRPVFLYLMVMYAAFEWGWEKALPLSLVVGVMRDLVGTNYLGSETFALFLTSGVMVMAAQKLDRHSLFMRFSLTAIFVFAVEIINLTFEALFYEGVQFQWRSRILACGGSALASAGFAPFFFYFTFRWFGEKSPLKQYELFG